MDGNTRYENEDIEEVRLAIHVLKWSPLRVSAKAASTTSSSPFAALNTEKYPRKAIRPSLAPLLSQILRRLRIYLHLDVVRPLAANCPSRPRRSADARSRDYC